MFGPLRPASPRAAHRPLFPPSHRHAFTLVELLVVVAIVGLLAAMLFPAFAQARARGRQAVCASNLRQIVLAWQMYAADYDETACPSYFGQGSIAWDFSAGAVSYGPGLLTAYARDARIMGCPDNPFASDTQRPFNGYAYNATYLGGDWGLPTGWNYPPCPLALIVEPARTAAFADAGYSDGGPPLPDNYLRAPSQTASYQNSGNVHFRHNGFASVAYADGHVRAQPDIFPADPAQPEYGWLSADDSAYGPGMKPASARRVR